MCQSSVNGSSPYESFSTGPDYVLLNIKSPGRSNAIVVMENPESYLLFMNFNADASKEDYIVFMKKRLILNVSNSDYDYLLRTASGVGDDDYDKNSKLGRKGLLEKYTIKIKPGDFREIKRMEGVNTNLVIRMLIESGIRVHRDCESGRLLCSKN